MTDDRFISDAIVISVEGIILVATPALIRDFSPQVGRGAAMAFWTMGPVLICFLAQLVFIPVVFVMAGHWNPRKARAAEREHERMVARELAQLQGARQDLQTQARPS